VLPANFTLPRSASPSSSRRRWCSEKLMFQVFQVFRTHVAGASGACYRCCVARRCYSESIHCNPMFQVFQENVASVSGACYRCCVYGCCNYDIHVSTNNLGMF
jgi:hypothetical protein